MSAPLRCDVVVIGGGIGGLWTHNRLLKAGYRSILLEANQLGGGETCASHGFIRGGTGKGSEVIGAMPGRWAACLAGRGELDLGAVRLATRESYLWSNDRLLGERGNVLASQMLRGRPKRLARQHFPDLLRNPAFRGVAYDLDQLIVDIESLLTALAARAGNTIFRHRATAQEINSREFSLTGEVLATDAVVLATGANSAELSSVASLQQPVQPVWIEWPSGQAPDAFWGHCITAAQSREPTLTLSTHHYSDRVIWYLGGALASTGGELDSGAQVDAAIRALGTALPWVKVPRAAVRTLRTTRCIGAEAGLPAEPFVEATGRTLTCWPTSLSLAPAMADAVIATLPLATPEPGQRKPPLNLQHVVPPVAAPPWRHGGENP